MKEKYFEFVKKNEDITELYIYGEIKKPSFIERWLGIDDPTRVDAFSFKEALEQVDTKNLLVRINSMGGSVADGLAIYSLLSDFKGHLTTKVDGMACSAASVIFMAGEERIMSESSLIMIHNAWSSAEGDSNDLRKAADDLEMITKPSVNIYCKKTGLSEDEVKQMMDVETWLDYNLSLEKGFCTNITKDNEAQQSIKDMSKYIKNLVAKNIELEKQLEQLKNTNVKEKDPWSLFFGK